MPLYNKYRPDTFDNIVGNNVVIESLKKAVTSDDPPHSYLMVGPYGCGKTTIARIAAAELGCTGDDFREVDSADFRGIDTIRDMRRQSGYQGLNGLRRAWLLDECHKLSSDAQSALLKALETPPDHVYYFLATTEPNKLLDTIKSRCAKYEVSLLNEINMKRLLRRVVTAEKDTLEKEVYDQIIQDSMGHGRDALQILEQVLNTSPENRLAMAKRTAEQQSKTIELCRTLLDNSPWSKVKAILNGLQDQQPESIRQSILGYSSKVLLAKENNRAAAMMEAFETPRYDMGFAGIVYCCYVIVNGAGVD